jgi:hypothetical protein
MPGIGTSLTRKCLNNKYVKEIPRTALLRTELIPNQFEDDKADQRKRKKNVVKKRKRKCRKT